MSRESLGRGPEDMPISGEVRDEGQEKGPVSPTVVGIYISWGKDEPTQKRRSVHAEAGIGLAGDRYRVGVERGTYSGHKIPEEWRNITIISHDGIEEARQELVAQGNTPFDDSETRRNIVVAGVSAEQLNALVEGNHSIWLGGIEVRAMKEAPPCNVPSQQYGKPGFINAFEGRGGVRGTIVSSGEIHEGDRVSFLPPQASKKLFPYDFSRAPSHVKP